MAQPPTKISQTALDGQERKPRQSVEPMQSALSLAGMMEWWGAYKISETESEYLIFVRLPNHDDQQNVDVIVGSDAVVTINVPLKNRSQLRQIVPLPPGVSSDGIDAVLKNDTLTLVLPKKLTDPKPYDNAFSSEDWEEIKSLALQILETNLLDTPEDHLAYVRKQLSRVAGNAR